MPYDWLHEFMGTRMRLWDVPGAVVAVVDRDEAVAIGAGTRDVQRARPVDTHTLFPIGSIGKSTSAVLAELAVANGAASWTAPVVHLVPELARARADQLRDITMGDVFSHQTGMASYQLLCGSASAAGREEIVRVRLPHLPASLPACSHFYYSNLMFLTGCHAIEASSGVLWEDMLTALLSDKLGLADIRHEEQEVRTSENIAIPYVRTADGQSFEPAPIPLLPRVASPCGTAWYSAEDMVKVMRLHLSGVSAKGTILTTERLEFLRSPRIRRPRLGYPEEVAGPVGYALGGWITAHYQGERLLFHGCEFGELNGITCLLPDHGFGVTVFCNVRSRHSHTIKGCCFRCCLAFDILDRLLNGNGGHACRCVPAYAGTDVRDIPSPRSAVHVDSWGNARLGVYEHPAFGEIAFTAGPDARVRMHYGSLEFLLMKHTNSRTFDGFCPNEPDSRVRIGMGPDNQHMAVALEPAVESFTFTRSR